MSSSLSSLILIAVVWLLLLAPLFLRSRAPVRQTSKALSETRVLHEGGSDITRPRKRPLPAESLYRADVDDDIELVDAEPEQVIIDDTGRDLPGVIDGEVVGYRPLDDEDTGEFAPVDARQDVAEGAEVDEVDEDTVFLIDESSDIPDDPAEDSAENPADDAGVTADESDDAEDAEVVEGTEDVSEQSPESDASPRFTSVPVAYLRGGDIDVSVGTDDETLPDETADQLTEFVAEEDAGELTDEELSYAAARRGRGFYDPETSQRLAEQRQTRRKRVLSVLAALCVVSVVAAVVLGGAVWSAVVVTVALSGVYLYYLRRQVVEEAELRQRRIARMRRARLGVRNTDDRELGVPDRLLRPGAVVVESDDADPEFADLDYIEYSDHGDYEDYADYGDERVDHIRAV